MDATSAYQATVIATTTAGLKGLLIGGCVRHTSAGFESIRDCRSWLDTVLESNRNAGVPCTGYVGIVDNYPDRIPSTYTNSKEEGKDN